MTRKQIWKVLCALYVTTLALTFTPLITPENTIDPSLFGMPYTLWVSIAQSIFLVLLTFIAALVDPFRTS